MSFIRNLRSAKFLSFLIVLLLTFSMAYPIIEGQWNPRAVLNQSGTGEMRVYGQNTETHSFDLGDTLQHTLNTPSKHDLDAYQVEVQATGGYGITSYLDRDEASKNQGDAKTYAVPSGTGLDNVYKATYTLSSGITRAENPADTETNTLTLETDDDAADFDGTFDDIIDTNDKLEMDTEELITQTVQDSTQNLQDADDGVKFRAKGDEVYSIELRLNNAAATEKQFDWELGTFIGDNSLGSGSFGLAAGYDTWYEIVLNQDVTVDSWYYVTLNGEATACKMRYNSADLGNADLVFFNTAGEHPATTEATAKVHFYADDGSYISSSINGGVSASWGTMNINSNLDGATIKLYTDSDSDDVGWSYSWTLVATLSGGEESNIDITSEGAQYLRYKVDVESDGTSSTWVDDIDIYYNGVSEDVIALDNDPSGNELMEIRVNFSSVDVNPTGHVSVDNDGKSWSETDQGYDDGANTGWVVLTADSSSEYLDASGNIEIGFDSTLQADSGWVVTYQDFDYYATCNEYGFQGDDAVGDFATADSVVESYDGDGVEIVAIWTGANEITPTATVDWGFEETNYAGGDLSTCTYSYESEFRQRYYRTCQEENMLVNGEIPTYTAGGGVEFSVNSPDSNRPTITFNGDNSTKYAFDIEIRELTIKDYDYDDGMRLEISDEDQVTGKIDFTLENNGGEVRLRSTAIKVEIPYEVKEVGVWLEDMSQEDSGRWLIPINEFRVTYGSTTIRIHRCGYEAIVGDGDFDAGESIRVMVSFKTESDDPYYRYTGNEERIKQGILVGDFEQVGNPIFRADESQYVVQAKLDVPTIWENYTFGLDKLDENYIKYCSKAEIVRYESNMHGDKLDYLETFEATYITEKNIFFGDLKFSPKYYDMLRLTLDMPELVVTKESVDFRSETARADEIVIEVVLPERPFDVEQPYCEIDTGKLSTLPQRFNYFVYQQVGENEFQQVEGRLNGYKLYWLAHEYTMEESGVYRWIIVAQEKTLEQKFAVMWSSITRTELPVGSIVIEYDTPEYTPPEVDIPEWNLPAWKLPKITLPRYSVKYAAPKVDLTKLSSYASLILPVASLMSIMLAITISLYTIRSLQQREKKEQYMIAQ